jgi:pyruvate/2-oxoglutarate dehydrogenase complex dihydrolipoamide acyltransferase (E2) component
MRRFELRVPELGLGGTPITVGAWLVRRGERVSAGDSVVELVAGDAVVDLTAPADGILVRKFAAEDEPVAVGGRLAVFGADDDPAQAS